MFNLFNIVVLNINQTIANIPGRFMPFVGKLQINGVLGVKC